jgi:hypothetical protein
MPACQMCRDTGYEGFHDAGRLCWRPCPACPSNTKKELEILRQLKILKKQGKPSSH